MMHFTNLGGHSGCKVLLCETDEKVFIRKISSSRDYNIRLERQADKQCNFRSKYIKVPAVLGRGFTEDGLFYFDMQYIQGITLSEYIKKIEIGKIKGLVQSLVLEIIDFDYAGESDTKLFLEKISLIESQVDLNNSVIYSAIRLLREHDWSRIKKGKCHGDLTLENIIVKNDELYLIDFLDSFYDSGILDIATLLQDSLVLWSYRGQDNINENTIIRLIVFRDILIDMIKDKINDSYNDIYYVLLLKLIRICPYTRDELTINFLNEKIRMVMDLIQEAEEQT